MVQTIWNPNFKMNSTWIQMSDIRTPHYSLIYNRQQEIVSQLKTKKQL